MVDDFITGKHGKTRIKYPLPQLEPILKETYGVILYQEQVMKIAQVLAKYTLAEADELRKAIGKKKPEVLAKHRERFCEGASRNGVDPKAAEKLFLLIDKFGGYGFNKSHSVAYALIAYQTAYLKAHFPVQFMAALLTQDMGNQDKTIKNIAECREMGIRILPPDINESQSDFSVVDGAIRFGLGAVKNVGLKAVESIIEERNREGPFPDLVSFCRRIDGSKVNRRVLEGLIQCGAFDFTGCGEMQALCIPGRGPAVVRSQSGPGSVEHVLHPARSNGSEDALFQGSDRGDAEWDEKEKLTPGKGGPRVLHHRPSPGPVPVRNRPSFHLHHPGARQPERQVRPSRWQGSSRSLKIKRTKKGDKMAILTLEDQTGSVEVVIFPDVFTACSPLLKGDEPLLVQGTAEVDERTRPRSSPARSPPWRRCGRSPVRNVEIRLRGKCLAKERLKEIRNILFRYPGEASVLLQGGSGSRGTGVCRSPPSLPRFPCAES